eukprot:3795121-Amphidinium_carterae.1
MGLCAFNQVRVDASEFPTYLTLMLELIALPEPMGLVRSLDLLDRMEAAFASACWKQVTLLGKNER